jgi:hypothetical protein
VNPEEEHMDARKIPAPTLLQELQKLAMEAQRGRRDKVEALVEKTYGMVVDTCREAARSGRKEVSFNGISDLGLNDPADRYDVLRLVVARLKRDGLKASSDSDLEVSWNWIV